MQYLINISRYYGNLKEFTLAGGGNTSYKDERYIWIKASGASLATIDENGFACLDREKVRLVAKKKYSTDLQLREVEVKEDLIAANSDPKNIKRPSVETSLHEIINYSFVVHTHPTLINALTCSEKAEEITEQLFGEEVLFIKYAPGYELFKLIEAALVPYRKKFNKDPKIIFLKNHGIVVSANSISEIQELYGYVTEKINSKVKHNPNLEDIEVQDNIVSILPAIRMILSDENLKIARLRHHNLHANFYKDNNSFKKASLPFTPDIIVYCKGKYIYLEKSSNPDDILTEFKEKLEAFRKSYGYSPKIILIKNYGLVAVEDTAEAAEIALDVYDDLLKISFLSENFGGPHFLSEDDITFVDNWEVENYRRQISKGNASLGIVEQKIAIVTGGAQGFGAGIAGKLVRDRANVIIADLNKEVGMRKIKELKKTNNKNEIIFIQTNVSQADSVKSLIKECVKYFGGIDIFISNAGILRAGSLDEMDEKTFHDMTLVNYESYFIVTKYASAVMKLQSKYKNDHFADIIQINSKSGLRGSNKNFAYAGGKFGGLGLTQSFALELAPYKIKVNSICPGNFFEGPLWSDPEKGLFVQYLQTGKVPGAKSVEDVKRFYENQVPLDRGCQIDDVMKALYYIIDQKYETGQAVPVTGGQVMLN